MGQDWSEQLTAVSGVDPSPHRAFFVSRVVVGVVEVYVVVAGGLGVFVVALLVSLLAQHCHFIVQWCDGGHGFSSPQTRGVVSAAVPSSHSPEYG